MSEPRAILFDLDDTLYPYSAFVCSGFAVVSRRVAADYGLSFSAVLRALRRAFHSADRGRELQRLCDAFALPGSLVPALVSAMREHTPRLRIPVESTRVLADLRRHWRIGILTNGQPDVQRRKIQALGLEPLVDVVVCATETGDGTGKPARAGFDATLERLGVAARSAVFVGNDPVADIAGARGAGLQTIHLVADARWRACGDACPGVHAQQLADVPAIAQQLVPVRTVSHAV